MHRRVAEQIFLLATLAMLAVYSGTRLAYAAPVDRAETQGYAVGVESTKTPNVKRSAPIPQTKSSQLQTAALAPSVQSIAAETLGPNLIQNPSLESTGSNGLPINWRKGGYGTNTRTLTYPATPAQDGAKAVAATISSYSSGDAKWYFDNVPVTPGSTYRFSDFYTSNVASEVNVQYTLASGGSSYAVLGKPGPASSYQNFTAQFVVPANAVSLTVFHVIKSTGTLTTDNFSLQEVTQSPGAPNLVTNGDLETANGSLPVGWLKGGYGTNTRLLTYPVTGNGGGKAARVAITSYTSGDAKWHFTPIQLSPGVYTYTDEYQSNVPSIVTLQIHNADGSYSYANIANNPASPGSFTSQSLHFTVPEGAQDITIFHLIKQVGTLTIDNVAIQENTDANGAVTFRFDDGWQSQHSTAAPKLNSYDFKGTFYIITNRIAENNYSGFVSKAQVKDLYTMGHEIGAHTQNHLMLTELSDSEQWQEINGSRQDLLSWNVGPINSFAYPFGDYNQTSIDLVRQAGFSSAAATLDGYNVPSSDHYQLSRQVALNSTTLAQMKGWVDQAMAQKSWLILEFHRVDTSGDLYAVTPTLFNDIVDYVKQTGIRVVTIDEGVRGLNP